MDDFEGFLDEPVAEVTIKPWHILALLGVGGVAAYFLLSKKDEPAPQAAPAPKQTKPAGTSGLSDCVALGEQTEPLYEDAPLVEKAREYKAKGWTVFKIPTGHENVMGNRERFEIQKIFAAPPGLQPPPHLERVSF